jgi:hypothetical protein
MVSILKGFVVCGKDQCADIEISGEVLMNPGVPILSSVMTFKSEWRGRILYAINSGNIVWSRVNSEESFASDPVRREVVSCLESVLQKPSDDALKGVDRPTCEGFGLK